MSSPVVSVQSISKSFGRVQALREVSFEVLPGEIFGLLGPNGAGKTTAIRIMMDIFKADSGEVSLFGGKLDEPRKRRIGYMPEERGLYKDSKVEPTLIYFAMLKGLNESTARQRLDGWLKRLDLYEHRQKLIQELSKGMQQKAQLIATLLHEPDLIVVDEPFSGLDPVNTRLVKDIIEEQRESGKAIIMSTHQMYQVEALCNRIALIDHGSTVLYGDLREIKRNFTGNAIVVEGQGDFSHVEGVLDTRAVNGSWHLALEPGVHPQDILRALATRDNVGITRFAIEEPSLDDIFIATVSRGGEQQEVRDA